MSEYEPTVPPIDEIEFVDEVPRRSHPFGVSKWEPFLKQIQKATQSRVAAGEPRRAAVLVRYDRTDKAVKESQSVRTAAATRGKFKVEARSGAIYVTYLGD
jgi:hypothetical protein